MTSGPGLPPGTACMRPPARRHVQPSSETRHEPPLSLVQREAYVWYQKGGQILYTIADYIGADKVNGA